MDCPVCKESMIILEHNMIETDYCPGCGGIWLDSGELELLTENKISSEQIFIPAGKMKLEGEKVKKCPLCKKRMEKAVSKSDIIVDICSKGHGIWFDKGELLDIISSTGDIHNNPVKQFLKDILKS
jgi:hypothetical protein